MNTIDVKKLKAQLTLSDYETILKFLDIPIFSKSDKEWRCYSADKHRNAYDGSVKLYFYTDNRIFISYTMGRSYDIVGLTQQRLLILGQDASFIDSVEYILSVTGLSSDKVTRKSDTKLICNWEDKLGRYIRFKQNGSEIHTYLCNILDELDVCYPQQWIDEGISVDTMDKYMIRYYPRLQQTCIPCFNQQGLVGIRCRNWNPDLIDKAKYIPLTVLTGETYKFNTNEVLFGLNYNHCAIEATGQAIIVESEKAVMKLDTWFGSNNIAVGMFGSNLGLKRRNQLVKLGVKTVYYVVDNDWIGKDDDFFNQWQKKIQSFVKLWDGFAQVYVVWDNLNLLSPKENAVDRDYATWEKLWESKELM